MVPPPKLPEEMHMKRLSVPLVLILLSLTAGGWRAVAQATWTIDTVAAVDPDPVCGYGYPYTDVAGLGFAPDGTAYLAWAQQSGCGGNAFRRLATGTPGGWALERLLPRVSCTAYDPDDPREPYCNSFGSGYTMAVRADGVPFSVYSDTDDNPWGYSFGTYRVPENARIESLGWGDSQCSGASYVLDFAPGATVPHWLTRTSCGQIKLNGGVIFAGGILDSTRGYGLAIGPAGQRHVVYNNAGAVYYSNGSPGGTQFATINRFSPHVHVGAGADNVMHVVLGGVNSTADYDQGELWHFTSADGVNWTQTFIERLYGNVRTAFGVDPSGRPAVVYRTWDGAIYSLKYAVLADGVWRTSVVTTFSQAVGNDGTAQRIALAFDPDGQPAIAYYDAGEHAIKLARSLVPANRAPVAGDDSATTPEDTAVSVAVLANDSDPDNDQLSVSAVGAAGHGSTTIEPAGTVRYVPDANFAGSDAFTYTIADEDGATSTAAVAVNVMPVNDVPVAAADAATTVEGIAVAVHVTANDSDIDGDPLAIQSITQPVHGTAAIGGTSVTYTPADGFAGDDAFTYTVSDGQGGSATAAVAVRVAAGGGGQSRDVDAFLAYPNLLDRSATLPKGATHVSLTIAYGGRIDAATFTAMLNGVLCAGFHPAAGTSETVILSLEPGRNTLILSVDGGTASGRIATDRDRLTFTVLRK